MGNIHLKQLDSIIQIIIPEVYIEKIVESKFYLKYIPNVELITPSEIFDYQINFKMGKGFLFINNITKKTLTISAPLDLVLPTHEAVIVIVDYIFEYLNGVKGRYTVHGSSFSYKGKGVLVLGQMSGLGKTTLNLNMCLKGAKFIGDDKILINSFHILGGAKRIHYNKEELKKSVPIDLTLKENQINSGFQVLYEPIQLDLIIFPIITLSKGFFIKVLKREDLEFTLFEEMSRKIRGISKRIGGKYVLPSIDTKFTAKVRALSSQKIAERVRGVYLSGDIKSVMKYLQENL